MDFISSLIKPISSLICTPLARQINYLVNPGENKENMDRDMDDLVAERKEVLKKVEDGKKTQQKSTAVAERWLENVGDAESKVKVIRDKYEKRCCLVGTCSFNCWSTYRISKKAFKLHVEMTQLKAERSTIELLRLPSLGHGQAMPTGPINKEPLKDNVAKIIRLLNDDKVGVIGIYGMGGVGKTTLLKEINNSVNCEGPTGFKYMIFVTVSQDCQLRTLQTRIAGKLGLQVKDDDDEIGIKIFNLLKEKSFLLLLDDMWEAIKLDEVGIPDISSRGNNDAASASNQIQRKQKVVLTTRSFDVCTRMGADETIKVECLNKDNALALFYESVGAWIHDSSPSIKSLAEKVAGECGGLPLALSVIGKSMSSKRTPGDWHNALTSLKRPQAGYVVDEGSEIFTKLEFSYRNLKDDLKQCFLFCSLWPEDYSIGKHGIIAYCIGQGYINDFDDFSEAWNKGNSLIEDLKRAGLLEPGGSEEEQVKMHDVLRDLALWIQSDYGKNPSKCLVKARMGLREAPRDSKIWAEAQVISLMENDIRELGPTPTYCFNCPLLLRFTVRANGWLDRIHHGFFRHMPALTFLDLSGTSITELPPDIGELKMLQHLDLSGTKLTCLPREVGNLLKLRYLDLSFTSELKDVPSGVISRLLQLQVLNLVFCGKKEFDVNGISDDDTDNDEGSNGDSAEQTAVDKFSDSRAAIFMPHGVIDTMLFDLESSLQRQGSLKAVAISVHSCEQFQRLSTMPRIFTLYLAVSGLRGLSALSLTRNMWRHALVLMIDSCTDARVLEFDGAAVENDDYCPVEELDITQLYQLEKIQGLRPTVFLPFLRSVEIGGCHRLKNVSWVAQLPSLDKLKLIKCNGMEQVIGGTELAEEMQHMEATTFPSLRKLTISDLPELTCICDSAAIAFPALQDLYVRGCPKLMLPESLKRYLLNALLD